MKMFRYYVKWCDDFGNGLLESRGYISAKSFAKAMKNIEKAYTDSDGVCNLIKVELYEAYTTAGMLDDQTIDEICEMEVD